MNRTIFFLQVLIISLFISGCSEKNTTNAQRSYKYWAGQPADKNVKVINGKYWESSHWSKEYILFLEIQPTKIWLKQFIGRNELIPSQDSNYPTDAPLWFKPPDNYKVLQLKSFDQGSRYFFDTVSNHMFIYEIQL